MKLLLTSSGVSNASIRDALVRLLGKPIEESTALLVPTGIYPFGVGPVMAARLVRGEAPTPLAELGWASVGLLELTALPSIDRDVWLPGVEAADALLVWGGDPVYLSHWLRESGLTDVLPSLDRLVYVGTSAGAIATARTFGETYTEPLTHSAPVLSSEEVAFGDVGMTFVTAAGAGFVDFTVIPHLDNPNHGSASMANARTWAARLPVPTYAIDDATALLVVDGTVEVVSEGAWRLFPPA
ncbi:MAG TPA: Type 1 glutamine amidotransferase-like domain-containing protein [Mycobacteriales bacterium]|jgi:dipeptidase E|nr:Type 1 glutamine amidotransferase-like domain-containing protein [Mycobacteriales bacterium]